MTTYVCAGIARSGSTWLYNAMRVLLLRRYPGLCAGWVGDLEESDTTTAPAVLVKLHEPDETFLGAGRIILTCHRDLRDIAASVQSMGWARDEAELLHYVANARTAHEFWLPHAAADLSYAEIIDTPREALRRVADAVSVPVPAATIEDLAAGLAAIPNNRAAGTPHDPEYLTHSNHRNDGRAGRWRDTLPAHLAREIAERHHDWLARMGYEI